MVGVSLRPRPEMMGTTLGYSRYETVFAGHVYTDAFRPGGMCVGGEVHRLKQASEVLLQELKLF